MNSMNTGTIHVVTIVCHTAVLITIIIGAIVLSGHAHLDAGTIAFLSTLGGVTGGGLVINGRRVPQAGQRDTDLPPQV